MSAPVIACACAAGISMPTVVASMGVALMTSVTYQYYKTGDVKLDEFVEMADILKKVFWAGIACNCKKNL